MDPTPKTLDPEGKPKPFHIPNGALKKHHHARPPPPAAADLLYRECLKNHAAAIGGHALDGCGEFMPSPTANPADPTSLKCAACGCHRNFHRRLLDPHHGVGGEEGQDEMDGHGEDDDDDEHEDTDDRHHRSSSSPPAYLSSAPHMLLALSAGLPGAAPTSGPNPGRPITPQSAPAPSLGPPQPRLSVTPVTLAAGVLPRKRFRTKFSSEQKERMQELSEKLGWRMQKRDEGIVEEWCKEIGVGKGVFKVWMHNNKHNFLGPTKRLDGSGGDGGAGGGGGESGGGGGGGGGIEGNDNGNGNNSHVVNGSSSSS